MPCPSQTSWFDHPNNIWWGVQSIKLLVMLSSDTKLLVPKTLTQVLTCNQTLLRATFTVAFTLWRWNKQLIQLSRIGFSRQFRLKINHKTVNHGRVLWMRYRVFSKPIANLQNRTENITAKQRRIRQAMHVLRNTEARSRNHRCRGKAINITHVCVTMRMRACGYPGALACVCACVHTCSLAYPTFNAYVTLFVALSLHIFRHYLINGAIFGNKLLKIMCVFWFSLQLLSKKFLMLRRIQRDIIINVKTSPCKVPVILIGF